MRYLKLAFLLDAANRGQAIGVNLRRRKAMYRVEIFLGQKPLLSIASAKKEEIKYLGEREQCK